MAAFTVLCSGWGMRLDQLAPTVARIVDEAQMPAVAVLTWMLRTVEIGQAPAGLWLFVQLGRYAAERLHAAGLPPAPGDETKRDTDAGRPPDLFIGNLPYNASEHDLFLFIDVLFPLRTVGIPKAPDGRGRGVAFVTLAAGADLDAVVEKLHGVIFQGRRLRVSRARPAPPR